MCVGALLECDVAALVFAVPNAVDGAAGTVLQLAQHPSLARRLQVVSGHPARRRRRSSRASSTCVPLRRLIAAAALQARPGTLWYPLRAERCPSG